jgi:hypothetical protein
MKINLLAILLLAFATAMIAQQRESAVVIKVRGEAFVQSADSDTKRPLKNKMLLTAGDRISTGEKSFVAVKFLDDASLIRVRSNSSLVIRGEWSEDGKSQEKDIFVTLGSIWSKITRSGSIFSIGTPTAVASVKGTEFWTIQLPDGNAMFICLEGMVEIKNEQGVVLVRKGQTANVAGQNSAPQVRRTQPGDIPAESEEDGERFEIEIEFENDQQEQRTLIIDVER